MGNDESQSVHMTAARQPAGPPLADRVACACCGRTDAGDGWCIFTGAPNVCSPPTGSSTASEALVLRIVMCPNCLHHAARHGRVRIEDAASEWAGHLWRPDHRHD